MINSGKYLHGIKQPTEDWKGKTCSVRLQKRIYHHLRNGKLCQAFRYERAHGNILDDDGEGLMYFGQQGEARGRPFPGGCLDTCNAEFDSFFDP